MRIKSGVWYWLAVASGAVGMLYALGFAGSIEALGVISDTDFITAMVLLLLALFFARLGDHAAEREVQRRNIADERAVHLLREGGIPVIGPQARLDMADRDLLIKGRQRPSKRRGRVARAPERGPAAPPAGPAPCRARARVVMDDSVLLLLHDVQVILRRQAEDLHNGVQHLAVLPVRQQILSNSGRCASVCTNGAILIASGRVPKTDITLIFFMRFLLRLFRGLVLLVRVAMENNQHTDRAHHDHGADEDQGLHLAVIRQHDGRHAENGREHIGDGDGLLLAEAHVDQAMVHMAAVGMHRL